jgi:hypothetical protein
MAENESKSAKKWCFLILVVDSIFFTYFIDIILFVSDLDF